MTLLAFAEELEQSLASKSDKVMKEERHERVVLTVQVGRQTFVVTCEQGERDRDAPAV